MFPLSVDVFKNCPNIRTLLPTKKQPRDFASSQKCQNVSLCRICQILIDTIFYQYRYLAKFSYRYLNRYFRECLIDIDIFRTGHIDSDIDIDIFKISLAICSNCSYQYFVDMIFSKTSVDNSSIFQKNADI